MQCRQVPVSLLHLRHAEPRFSPKGAPSAGLAPPAVALGISRVGEQHPSLHDHSRGWEGWPGGTGMHTSPGFPAWRLLKWAQVVLIETLLTPPQTAPQRIPHGMKLDVLPAAYREGGAMRDSPRFCGGWGGQLWRWTCLPSSHGIPCSGTIRRVSPETRAGASAERNGNCPSPCAVSPREQDFSALQTGEESFTR